MGPRILVDIDSTLYPANEIFLRLFREMYGIELGTIRHWDFYQRHMDDAEFGRFISEHFHAEHEILAARPFRGAVEALRAWADAGARIHIVSDRLPNKRAATRRWLQRIGVPCERLVVRSPIDKIAYARRARIDLIVDDRPDTLAAAVAAGIPAATLVYPYNRRVLAEHPGIMRARSWTALRALVDAHLADRPVAGPAADEAPAAVDEDAATVAGAA